MKNSKGINRANKRFTAIDFLVCLLLIVAIAYIGIRIVRTEKFKDESNVSFDVAFVFPQEKKDVFKAGDIVLTSDGKNEIGKISNVSYSAVTQKNFDLSASNDENSSDFSDENYVSVETEYSSATNEMDETKPLFTETIVEGYVKVTVSVSGNLEYDNGKYFLNGSSFKIGDEIEITTKEYSSFGKCISISSLKTASVEE